MLNFPYPLERGTSLESKLVIGFHNPMDGGRFVHQGRINGVPNAAGGMTEQEGELLDKINRLIDETTDAVIVSAQNKVREVLALSQCTSGFFTRPARLRQMRLVVAEYVAIEVEHQQGAGMAEKVELAARLVHYLDLPATAYAAAAEPYLKLDKRDMRLLAENALRRIAERLPEYGAAFARLGWSEGYLELAERDGNLVRFYLLLKEYLDRFSL